MRRFVTFVVLLTLTALTATPAAAQTGDSTSGCPEPQPGVPVDPNAAVCVSIAQQHDADGIALRNGRFYTQATSDPTRGFAVVNSTDAQFWSEFLRLGGVPNAGYPISRPFVWDGFPTQAFQKLILQWRPAEGRAVPMNTIDLLHEAGQDDWLRVFRATPPIADWSADAGRAWPDIVAAHQALLTDPDLRAAYFAVDDSITRYGLPMAPIEDTGGVLTLRAQRAILQKWLTDTPWAQAGHVTIANGGDLAKEAGLLPASALLPDPAPAGPGVDYEPMGDVRNLDLDLAVEPRTTNGQPVTISLRITNPTSETIRWWTGLPVADFEVLSDGQVFWRYSIDKVFPAIAKLIELAPGESMTEQEVWSLQNNAGVPAPPGTYQAVGILMASANDDLRSPPATFTVR